MPESEGINHEPEQTSAPVEGRIKRGIKKLFPSIARSSRLIAEAQHDARTDNLGPEPGEEPLIHDELTRRRMQKAKDTPRRPTGPGKDSPA